MRGVGLANRVLGLKRGKNLIEAFQHRAVSRLLASWRPEIVHCHWVGIHASMIAKANPRNLVLTAWGSDINQFFDSQQSEADRRQIGEALSKCSVLTGDAEDLREKAEKLAGCRINRVFLPLGIETRPFQKDREAGRRYWRNQLGVPADVFLFGSFRAWAVTYRHDQILEAFAEICKRTKRSVGLLYKVYVPSGGGGFLEDEQRIRKRAIELGLDDRIWWLRDVSRQELPAVYAATDAIVNYPQRDALPVTFFEAAAACKPVITCWHPAYDVSLVRDNFCITQGDNFHALADAMMKVVEESLVGDRDEKLAAAERQAVELYSESAAISALQRIYEKLLEGRAEKSQ
jgi:glycosyltransferase involved in cell wall biosynthesis